MNATLDFRPVKTSRFGGAPASVIGKCKVRGCRCAIRADQGVYVDSGREATEQHVAYLIGNDGYYARCAEHGLFQLRTLKGRHVPEKKCDARCMNATGPNCECSCGGANHGHSHT